MQPTLTDANLVTGRIDPEYFLGGRIKANMESVTEAFQNLSKRLGMSMEEIARGAIRIANNNMINALKLVSVNRGYDPRDFNAGGFWRRRRHARPRVSRGVADREGYRAE